MPCQGCTERREWIKNWVKVGAERAKTLFSPQPIEVEQDGRTDTSVDDTDASHTAANEPDSSVVGLDTDTLRPVSQSRRRRTASQDQRIHGMKLGRLQNRLLVTKPVADIIQSTGENWGEGRGGRPWRRLKERMHVRDQWTCQSCGLVTDKLELDHIVNQAVGGTDDESNLQSLCVECHKLKTSKESKNILK